MTQKMENNEFTIVESKEEMMQLREELKNYFPWSVSVYNTLLMMVSGCLDKAPVLVHRKPGKPTICVIRQETHEQLLVYFITLYCAEERKDDLMELLRKTTLIQWQPCIRFICTPDMFTPGIVEILHEKGLQKISKTPGKEHSVETIPAALFMFPEKKLFNLSNGLPVGYRFGSLKSEDFIKIHENLPYKDDVSLGFLVKTYMRTVNSAIYYGNDNELVVWSVQDRFGQIGKLHTMPEHREKGLASAVLQNMKERFNAMGLVPFCCTQTASDYFLGRGFSVGFDAAFLRLAS